MAKVSKKHILLVAYYWPPAGGSGVQRWLFFVKHLISMGHKIDVLTVSHPTASPQDDTLLEHIPKQVQVHRMSIWEPGRGLYKYASGESLKPNLFSKFVRWVRANLFFPDARCLWIGKGSRWIAKFINTQQPDWLITTGPPHSVHMMGYAQRNHPKTRWMADFRDPWVDFFINQALPMTPWTRKRHQKWEQKIVQAARVSYGEGTKKLREDRGLIRYLLSHWHTTPFEMCEIKFHIKLPIFVARQWIRHRTANVNEYSARYSVLDKEFYVPEMDQLGSQSTTNKQGRSNTLDKKFAKQAQDLIQKNSEQLYDDYQNLLNGKLLNNDEYVEGEGLARELARTTLPLNYYTQWYWKVDLHNLMHFLRLRADSHAQYEIQIYAEKMVEILKKWVPLTYEAFEDYRSDSFQLSKEALKIVKDKLANKKIKKSNYKLSPRELRELEAKFNIKLS